MFIEKEYSCFHTGIEKGSKDGKIDVVGLRNTVGDLGGHTEVISVEVKPEKYLLKGAWAGLRILNNGG